MCTPLAGSKLENCLQAEIPCLKKESGILEKIKWADTHLISELYGLLYTGLLDKLHLSNRSSFRLKGDLILM